MTDEAAGSVKRGIYRRAPLFAAAAIAVIIGVIARFKGLGKWPFEVDEYYFGRSVENVLRFGTPAYECGGYYVRGILMQYLAAGLRLAGFAPELAPRAIAAVSSLIALPAVFLLGRRVHGRTVGVLAVALLALSVWEIEIARFGRMYAPFQAVFVWYLVFFVRYTIDRETKALWGMAILSIVGALVWEGGALMAVANLLPPFINHTRGRLTARQWAYLGAMALLVPPLYWLTTNDLRYVGDVPPWPPGYLDILAQRSEAPDGPYALWTTLTSQPLWMVLGLPLLACALWALKWIFGFRERWLAAAGLLAALAAALAHQFLVVGAVLVLLLLTRLVQWRELFARAALPFLATIAVAAIFWTAFGLTTNSWQGDEPLSGMSRLVSLGYEFFGLPDIAEVIAQPWARAAPFLGLGLMLLLGFAAGRVILAKGAGVSIEAALLVLVAVMLLLVGLSDPPRAETRYIFFLYPLVVVLAISAVFRIAELVAQRPSTAVALGIVATVSAFALSEDFQPAHLRNIDSADVTFRRNMPPGVRNHYVGRGDIREVANWLAANTKPTDLVISGQGIASLDFYYPRLDFVFVDPSDARLGGWSCQRGTVDRWSNRPLVYSVPELRQRIAASPRSFIVIDSRLLDSVLADLQGLNPEVAWSNEYGGHAILRMGPSGSPGP
ncbi:MAG: glycosyltransferase family 39 protein [Gammaproteobacteria bacterium]